MRRRQRAGDKGCPHRVAEPVTPEPDEGVGLLREQHEIALLVQDFAHLVPRESCARRRRRRWPGDSSAAADRQPAMPSSGIDAGAIKWQRSSPTTRWPVVIVGKPLSGTDATSSERSSSASSISRSISISSSGMSRPSSCSRSAGRAVTSAEPAARFQDARHAARRGSRSGFRLRVIHCSSPIRLALRRLRHGGRKAIRGRPRCLEIALTEVSRVWFALCRGVKRAAVRAEIYEIMAAAVVVPVALTLHSLGQACRPAPLYSG